MYTTTEIPDIITFTFKIDGNKVTFSITSQDKAFFEWIHDNPYKTNGVTIGSNTSIALDSNSVYLPVNVHDGGNDSCGTYKPEDYVNRMTSAIKAATEAFRNTTLKNEVPELDQTATVEKNSII